MFPSIELASAQCALRTKKWIQHNDYSIHAMCQMSSGGTAIKRRSSKKRAKPVSMMVIKP